MRKGTDVDPLVLRALRGLRSRDEIAHGLRVFGHTSSAKDVWRWETGRNRPSARLLGDYAAVLGVTAADLYAPVEEITPCAS